MRNTTGDTALDEAEVVTFEYPNTDLTHILGDVHSTVTSNMAFSALNAQALCGHGMLLARDDLTVHDEPLDVDDYNLCGECLVRAESAVIL